MARQRLPTVVTPDTDSDDRWLAAVHDDPVLEQRVDIVLDHLMNDPDEDLLTLVRAAYVVAMSGRHDPGCPNRLSQKQEDRIHDEIRDLLTGYTTHRPEALTTGALHRSVLCSLYAALVAKKAHENAEAGT